MAKRRVRAVGAIGVVLLTVLFPGMLGGQSLDGVGVVPTGLLLRRMDGAKRVLMIGAHPDDEDTSLLAALSRRYGAETAYLALTRGEGGQNLIGPELWEGLGIIRTGELEAARDLDGGRQFFSRAFDFGYSKTATEAFSFWPREELLADVVWIIRRFRPQVIVAVFHGSPRDGHGQHQASGILAREAFRVAGDPNRFPEQLTDGVEPWAPLKLYELSRRRPEEATTTVPTGAYDPLLGRSELQLSMESRSFHRSQDMGAPRPMGPRTSGVRLEVDRTGGEGEPGIFTGIDTTLVGLTTVLSGDAAERVRTHLGQYRAALKTAQARLGGADPYAVVPALTEALTHLTAARDEGLSDGADMEFRRVLGQKIGLARTATLAAAGILVDVRVSDDVVIPGESVRVAATIWNGGPEDLKSPHVALDVPSDWTVDVVGVEGLAQDGSVAPETLAEWSFEVTLPPDADLSRLYYLQSPRDGYLYRWPDQERDRWGLPRDPAPAAGQFRFSLDGVEVAYARPWSYVGVNPARGEFRRPVLIVPAASVAVSPEGLVWPRNGQSERGETRTLTVSVRNEATAGIDGRVSLSAPRGWSVAPEAYDVQLAAEGAERSFAFTVRADGPVPAGDHVFAATLTTSDGRSYEEGFSFIDYEHIERAALFSDAEARISVVPVHLTAGLRVGYIMGPGDDGPEALRQMGADVTLLDADAVRSGAYADFDAVVVGVRAYETRSDLAAANEQLLDYARAGGTVVVQYQQYAFGRGAFAPFAVGMSRPAKRVSDETAAVTILAPDAPVFTEPNRITGNDFQGWVQERGLYFLSEWGDAAMPLLEMNDPDEEPTRGSLLVAPVGEGLYVYAALSFFRQWSSGVPGAYRLFANLVSLDAEAWNAYTAGMGRGR